LFVLSSTMEVLKINVTEEKYRLKTYQSLAKEVLESKLDFSEDHFLFTTEQYLS
jgi:hypothetical protein